MLFCVLFYFPVSLSTEIRAKISITFLNKIYAPPFNKYEKKQPTAITTKLFK